MLRVSFRVTAAGAEIARARLLELAPDGFEEVTVGEETELAAYTDERGAQTIRSVFSEPVSSEPVPSGWDESWRAFHRPVRAGGVWIGPPWEAPPVARPAVVVDPGRAFGTGAHPTTRACIELLAGHERGGVLDAGTGSGVVAVAAARLGFAPVFALDVDHDAVEAAKATAGRNGVPVQVWRADVLVDALPEADLVVANIELLAVEALLARRPAPRAITSGYLAHEAPRASGWEQVSRLELDGWAADLLAFSGQHF
ncbi:MAG: 50S ribosomal protein L11 methyltransferase [Gaiellaceae bacterium]|nr:50S ribosomal protein L11 methyltransferase [Actinomycetota bacterium]